MKGYRKKPKLICSVLGLIEPHTGNKQQNHCLVHSSLCGYEGEEGACTRKDESSFVLLSCSFFSYFLSFEGEHQRQKDEKDHWAFSDLLLKKPSSCPVNAMATNTSSAFQIGPSR